MKTHATRKTGQDLFARWNRFICLLTAGSFLLSPRTLSALCRFLCLLRVSFLLTSPLHHSTPSLPTGPQRSSCFVDSHFQPPSFVSIVPSFASLALVCLGALARATGHIAAFHGQSGGWRGLHFGWGRQQVALGRSSHSTCITHTTKTRVGQHKKVSRGPHSLSTQRCDELTWIIVWGSDMFRIRRRRR